MSLKLCIVGRAFSGKKTIAKMIQEKYGANNIKLFLMDEMIREVVDCVTPKKVVEETAVDPKAKGKAAPKKGEEAAPVDPWEGKDVEAFKAVGNALVQACPELTDLHNDGVLATKIDLVSLVRNDALLVDLFVEKLKLSYVDHQSTEQTDEEIRAGLVREKEIMAELDELAKAAEAAATDPKAKGKAPAKGARPQEEVLKEELDAIKEKKLDGWVLAGFPQSLDQMKLLEKALSGFQSEAELPKKTEQETIEACAVLATPM